MIVCYRCLCEGRARRLHYDAQRALFTCVEAHRVTRPSDGATRLLAGADVHGPQHTREAVADFLRHPRAHYPSITR